MRSLPNLLMVLLFSLSVSSLAHAQALDAGTDAGVTTDAGQDAGVIYTKTSSSGVTFSIGPTIPLLEERLADPGTGKAYTQFLGTGAGTQFGWGFDQVSFLGDQFDLIDLDLDVFATITQDNGSALDSVSAAGAVCSLNSIVCLGFGVDLLQYYSGAPSSSQLSGILAGNVKKQNLFPLLSVGFNFAIGPYSPPVGVEDGAAGLKRGNTVYFGW